VGGGLLGLDSLTGGAWQSDCHYAKCVKNDLDLMDDYKYER
jgi:hypothetical protein